MQSPQVINPFYRALLVVGVVFAISACAYGVMTVRGLNPRLADEQGLMGLMSQHGMTILVVELVLLGILTVAAIGTDDFGVRRAEARGSGIGIGGRESGVGDRWSGSGSGIGGRETASAGRPLASGGRPSASGGREPPEEIRVDREPAP
jgi:hypothetical protein